MGVSEEVVKQRPKSTDVRLQWVDVESHKLGKQIPRQLCRTTSAVTSSALAYFIRRAVQSLIISI